MKKVSTSHPHCHNTAAKQKLAAFEAAVRKRRRMTEKKPPKL